MTTFTDQDFERILREAYQVGENAARATVTTPVVVGHPTKPWGNNIDPTKPMYTIPGLCGFASVNVKPGNSRFANWLKKTGNGRKDSWEGGVRLNLNSNSQLYEENKNRAVAVARYLRNALGMDRIYADSRLD